MKEKEAKVSKHIAWSFMPLSFVLVILVTTTVLLLISDKNCLVHAARKKRRNGHPQSRGIRVLNQCGVKVDIYWINPDTGELASSSTNGDGIMYGGETGIDSYVGHEFEVREVENPKTKQCRTPNKCLTNYFEVNVNEDQSEFCCCCCYIYAHLQLWLSCHPNSKFNFDLTMDSLFFYHLQLTPKILIFEF
jgi:hypothetical protein